jgi:hypothetical protein
VFHCDQRNVKPDLIKTHRYFYSPHLNILLTKHVKNNFFLSHDFMNGS